MSIFEAVANKLFARKNAKHIDFHSVQEQSNISLGLSPTRKVRKAMQDFNDKLKLLRGDNIYDVIRLYYSTKGLHSEQFELFVDIEHGQTKEESALKVSRIVEEDILRPVGLRMIRCVMGRVIVSDEGIVGAFVNPNVTATKATYDVLGLPIFCQWFREQFSKHLQSNPTNYLTRILKDGQGNLTTVMETVQNTLPVKDISKFYPYFDFTPAKLMGDFQKSNSNVILFYGIPGSGKSSWMMEMLNARGWDDKIYLVDRMDVLAHPSFPDFVRELPAGSTVVTEDSDILVGKRTEGNVSMSALLNATAGIVARDVKLMISTNLTSTRDIDEALLRHGRCFKIMKFKPLTSEQASDIRDMMDLEKFNFREGRTDVTLAEAINAHEISDERIAQAAGFR